MGVSKLIYNNLWVAFCLLPQANQTKYLDFSYFVRHKFILLISSFSTYRPLKLMIPMYSSFKHNMQRTITTAYALILEIVHWDIESFIHFKDIRADKQIGKKIYLEKAKFLTLITFQIKKNIFFYFWIINRWSLSVIYQEL